MAEWLQSPLVVIGIAIAAMFFGYFFGLFEGRGQGYKKRQKEEAGDKKSAPQVEAEPLPPASPPAPSDEISVLDVSMAPDGELRLKVDGQRLDTSALGAEQRKRLIGIMTRMRPWLEACKSPPRLDLHLHLVLLPGQILLPRPNLLLRPLTVMMSQPPCH